MSLESIHPARVKGTRLFWLGIVLCVVAVTLFVVSGRAIPFSNTTTTIDDTGIIRKSISCGVSYVGWGQRLVYLLPLLAGIPMVIAGIRMRKSTR
jgi:hypothetical protein